MILSDEEFELQLRAAHDWEAATDEQKTEWEAQIAAAMTERREAQEAAQLAYEQQLGQRPVGSLRKPSRKVY